jgi:hypothetical protein
VSKVAKRNKRVRHDWRKAPQVHRHFEGQADLLEFINSVTRGGSLFFGITADTAKKTNSVRAAKLRCKTGVTGKKSADQVSAENLRNELIQMFDTNAEAKWGDRKGAQGDHRRFKTYNIREIRVNGTRYVITCGGSSPEALESEAERLTEAASKLSARAKGMRQGTLSI